MRFIPAVFLMPILYAALSAMPTLAPAAQATPVPDVKGDFASMNFLLGTWNCKETVDGRGAGRTETDVTTMAMDGHYMETKTLSKPFDTARTRNSIGDGWMGYDSKSHNWYSFGISNFGGFGVSSAPGWVGNTITWTDQHDSDGQALGVTVLTKVSDTQTTSVTTVKAPAGKHVSTDACTKAA